MPNVALKPILSTLIHLLLGAVIAGVVWWIAGDPQRILAQSVLNDLLSDPFGRQLRTEDLRNALVETAIYTTVLSAVAAAIWLIVSERTKVPIPEDEKKLRGFWVALLLVVIAGAGALIWRRFWLQQLIQDLTTGGLNWLVIGLILAGGFLTFFVSTQLFTKRTLLMSVMWGAWPRLTRRKS